MAKVAPGDRRRMHDGAQAVGGGAAQQLPAGGRRDGDRLAAGVLNIVQGDGADGRRGHRAAPGVDMVELHGLGARRAARLGARGRDHQESDARARRQVGVRRPRRCAAGEGDSRRREQRDAELRPDVLGVDAHARAARAARRGAGNCGGAVARLTLGDPLDPKAKLGPLVSEAQRRRVEGYIQAGVQEGARARRRRQAARRRSRAATTWSRRSSRTCSRR